MASALIAGIENRTRTDIQGRECGQTMAEYAVVLAVITPLLVAIFSLLGTNIFTEITKVAGYITF